MKPVPLAEMSFATFAGLLHSRFRVQASETTSVEVELIEATPHESAGEAAQADVRNFSLVFVGPSNQFLPQQTYGFAHDKLGTFDLFIVPVGKDRKGFQYEAIFNRPRVPAR